MSSDRPQDEEEGLDPDIQNRAQDLRWLRDVLSLDQRTIGLIMRQDALDMRVIRAWEILLGPTKPKL